MCVCVILLKLKFFVCVWFWSGQDHIVTLRRVVATQKLENLQQILASMDYGLIIMMVLTHLTVILLTPSVNLPYAPFLVLIFCKTCAHSNMAYPILDPPNIYSHNKYMCIVYLHIWCVFIWWFEIVVRYGIGIYMILIVTLTLAQTSFIHLEAC